MSMGKRIDFSGKVIGYLTVRELTPKIKGVRSRRWICDCAACGSVAEIGSTRLRYGEVTSCGCRPKLTLRAFNLVKAMTAKKQRLVKCLPSGATEVSSPEVRFFLEPSGRVISRVVAENAIRAREVIPLSDGLFADTAQTWVVA